MRPCITEKRERERETYEHKPTAFIQNEFRMMFAVSAWEKRDARLFYLHCETQANQTVKRREKEREREVSTQGFPPNSLSLSLLRSHTDTPYISLYLLLSLLLSSHFFKLSVGRRRKRERESRRSQLSVLSVLQVPIISTDVEDGVREVM